MNELDKHFADWESQFIGFGYGSGEPHTLLALRAFLDNCRNGDLKRQYDYEELEKAVTAPTAWLLISILCRANIIEYGTSPRFGWLTEQGIALRDYVTSKTADELAEIATAQREFNCFPDGCNCWPNGWRQEKLCHNPFWVE